MNDWLQPTGKVIEEYYGKFESLLATSSSDAAVGKVFSTWPRNTSLDEILAKVTVLNGLYNTRIWAILTVAQHIHNLRIDDALVNGDLDIVEKIAVVTMSNGKQRRNYSFASKYCAWHQPERFPIYDQYLDSMLWGYRKRTEFDDFHRQDMWNSYAKYVRIYDAFRSHFQLTEYSYRQIDKFLWQYYQEE